MTQDIWLCLDSRVCARGYSIALYHRSKKPEQEDYTIVLYLDGEAYWAYSGLSKPDAINAMDDLELAPGPRGDSSWLAVLSRCMLRPAPSVDKPPGVLLTKSPTEIGTWGWLQNLAKTREVKLT